MKKEKARKEDVIVLTGCRGSNMTGFLIDSRTGKKVDWFEDSHE